MIRLVDVDSPFNSIMFFCSGLRQMGSDVRGDPTAALLEVLDPSQHHAFVDTFLGLPFDLSRIVFVATANEEGAIPAPLRDRMCEPKVPFIS
jgi:ATP-dependent Lon protease